jgi:hypothetical protein
MVSSAARSAATARRSPARSCGVEFKLPVRDERNKKQENLEVKVHGCAWVVMQTII